MIWPSILPGERAAHCIGIGRIYITRIGMSVLLLGVLVSHVSRQMFNSSYKRYCSYLREWRNFVKIARWGGGGAKLDPIFPNQVKMIVKMEKWAIYYHRGKDILKKTDLFLWMLELWRLILVLTSFFCKNEISAGRQNEVWGRKLGSEGGGCLPCPISITPFLRPSYKFHHQRLT